MIPFLTGPALTPALQHEPCTLRIQGKLRHQTKHDVTKRMRMPDMAMVHVSKRELRLFEACKLLVELVSLPSAPPWQLQKC